MQTVTQTWEYISTDVPKPIAADGLNVYGLEGWDLVSTMTYRDRDGHPTFTYIFKRPKRN